MNELQNSIIEKINLNNGFITLDKFIKICMYDRNYGYYLKNSPIGKKGDFITSPEISQLFGEMIGLYIFDYWKNNINNNVNLIELGPGKGTLLSDILNITKTFSKFQKSLNIIRIETSNALIKQQKNNVMHTKYLKKLGANNKY